MQSFDLFLPASTVVMLFYSSLISSMLELNMLSKLCMTF